MQTIPLVSVIVPVYNSEPFLKECLDSLIRQTYSNIEVILVDDGSIDMSLSICEKYASINKKIKVIHTKNFGSSAARNHGILASSGDYITFIDSDDYVSTNYIEALINNLISKNSDATMAKECGVFVDKNGNVVEKKSFTNDVVEDFVDENSFLLFCKSKGFCDTRKMFKKHLLENIYFDETLGWGEDFFFMYNMACEHPHKMTTEMNAIYYYRVQIEKPSIARWQNRKMNNIIYKLHRILKIYKKRGIKNENTEFVSFYESCFNARYKYCLNKFLILQLLWLIPYRVSYFSRNRSFKVLMYSFFPYIYRILMFFKNRSSV